MAASSNDTVVWDAEEALVPDPLLLEIGRIIMIPADHHDPVVRLGQPTEYLVENLLIVYGLFKSKTAVAGYDQQRVSHSVLDAELEHHLLKAP